MRCNHFNAVCRQFFVQRVASIGLVPNQSFEMLIDKIRGERWRNKGDLMWCSRVNVDGVAPTDV